jgi:hypothetical protein
MFGRLPNMTSSWESTNTTGIYFAGALTQARDYKTTQSAFIQGFRYNVQALRHILEHRHHDRAWPYRTIRCDPDAIAGAILGERTRVPRSGGRRASCATWLWCRRAQQRRVT